MELHNSPSTQSLGVNSTAGESIEFSKGSKKLVLGLAIACVLLLAACGVLAVLYTLSIQSTSPPQAQEVCITPDCLMIAAEFKKNINTSVDPCEDFYHYACDGWIRDNPIPPSENEQATFFKISKEISSKLRNLIESATDLHPGSPVKKARDYYTSCMDEREVERTASSQLQEIIRGFGSWALDNNTWNESTWDWKEALLKIQEVFADKSALFSLEVVEDPTDSAKYLIKIQTPSLSLLENQYDNKKKTDPYLEYMVEVAVLLGSDNATAYRQMREVLEFEGKLAKVKPAKSVVHKQYFDTYKLQEIDNMAHNFSWLKHLNGLFSPYGATINQSEIVIVPTPKYLANMTQLASSEKKSTLSNYFIWTIIRGLTPFMSTPYRQAELKYKKKATNTKASQPRWLQCTKTMDYYRGLTFAAGYLYIEKVFDRRFIKSVKTMMNDMRQAFRDEVENLDWIDDGTRKSVHDKEIAMIEKVGYPKLCVNFTLLEEYYSGLVVDDSRYLPNELNISRWYSKKTLSNLRKPVSRDSWFSGPQMVNAFYLREHNEINVMAGILQPPFFYGLNAPSVVNYGGIGMVLAHELTHGFDTVGRRFNKFGELTDTSGWTNHSLAEFRVRAKCMEDQYSEFELETDSGTINLDGKLTLDENIADNGGFRIAFKAYQNWAQKHGKEKLIPGLQKTNEQMFFLSYAQVWCSSFTPEARFYRSKVDTHAIPKYRVKGVLTNSEAFAKAYNCPIGSKMNPGKRCRVW